MFLNFLKAVDVLVFLRQTCIHLAIVVLLLNQSFLNKMSSL